MIEINPQYETIFNPRSIDEDCNKIADEINDVVRMQIKEISQQATSMLSSPTQAHGAPYSLGTPWEVLG